MDQRNFENIVNLQMQQSASMLVSKREEYAPDEDVLQNFKDGAKFNDESEAEVLWGYTTKQLVSLKSMVKKDPTMFSMAQWDEKLLDVMNYMILLKAIVVEAYWKREEPNQPALVENKENVPA